MTHNGRARCERCNGSGQLSGQTCDQCGGRLVDDEAHEQDVLDCLDEFLSSNNRHARVDTSGPVVLREILIECERRAKQEVAYHLQHVPPEKRRPTYVFFCENETYGAFALRGRYDYIVLHIGIVPALLDFCIRMMAKAELWKNIGNPSGASDDRARLAFATVFMGECFSFLVRHELAHLVLGHCEFVAPRGGAATIEDTDGQFPAGADPVTIQALEVIADGHAAIWGVVRLPLILTVLGRHRDGIDEAHRAFQRTPEEAMRNYLLAMYFVFRLFYETTWNIGALTSRAHPPAPLRFHVACLHLLEYFTNAGDIEGQARLKKAAREIWELGEYIFSEALEQLPDPNAKRQVLSEEGERHFDFVRARAQTLPSSLSGLS